MVRIGRSGPHHHSQPLTFCPPTANNALSSSAAEAGLLNTWEGRGSVDAAGVDTTLCTWEGGGL